MPGDFQLPVRALGYQVAYDYPVTALGVQAGGPNGEILLEGTWACPNTPLPLTDATKTLHQQIDAANKTSPTDTDKDTEKEKARAAWTEKIAQRQAFHLVPHGRPDTGGHQRYRCPAQAGTVRCPLKPDSLRGGPNRPKIDAGPGPFGPPKICTQHSVTLPPEAGAKHWQPHPYGTEAWQDAYQPGRATVEGVNGHAKNGAHENLADASGRRIRGMAAQTFLMAFQLAHANTRKINNWQDTLPAGHTQPRKRPPRRRTKPLSHWTPRGYHQPQSTDTGRIVTVRARATVTHPHTS